MIRVVQIVQPSVNLICACAAGRLKQFGRDLHLSSAGALSTSLCVTDTEVRDESMNASQAKGSQGRSTGDTILLSPPLRPSVSPLNQGQRLRTRVWTRWPHLPGCLPQESRTILDRLQLTPRRSVLKGFAVNIVLPHAADRTQTTSPIDAEDT